MNIELSTGEFAQLQQLKQVTWDGDIIGKDYRDSLINLGLACRTKGFSVITENGIEWLIDNGHLKS